MSELIDVDPCFVYISHYDPKVYSMFIDVDHAIWLLKQQHQAED